MAVENSIDNFVPIAIANFSLFLTPHQEVSEKRNAIPILDGAYIISRSGAGISPEEHQRSNRVWSPKKLKSVLEVVRYELC